MKPKLLTHINVDCNTLHATCWFFLCCNIVVSTSFRVKVLQIGGGADPAPPPPPPPPPPRLSLQTPVFNRVNIFWGVKINRGGILHNWPVVKSALRPGGNEISALFPGKRPEISFSALGKRELWESHYHFRLASIHFFKSTKKSWHG